MCFTLSKVKSLGKWNWESGEIVHNPIIEASRKIPRTNKPYEIDIREYLSTSENAVIYRTLHTIIKGLPVEKQSLFYSHGKGSFDYRVEQIMEFMSKNIKYIPGSRKFDTWMFPDETLALGGGDCEDRAFLLAALLLASGVSGYVVRVVLGKLYDADSRTSRDHVWVMYKNEDGLWMCLEPLLFSKEAEKHSKTKKVLSGNQRHGVIEYIPYFAFNNTHLWRIKSNTEQDGFTDYIGKRKFWKEFNPAFATDVHNQIIDYALSDMNWVRRTYMKAFSLAIDTVQSYDPREHFDNGYVSESWDLVNENLKKNTFNGLAYAIHAMADFYAHTSYGEFADREPDGKRLVLFDGSMNMKRKPVYDQAPFDLNDTSRFSVNTFFYKDATRAKAVAYCNKKVIISGRFAQDKDPYQGTLERTFVYIPYAMRNAPDFPDRGCLPHHNEMAVDEQLNEDGTIPGGHKLYKDPKVYQEQLNLRFVAAKRHVKLLYNQWKTQQ